MQRRCAQRRRTGVVTATIAAATGAGKLSIVVVADVDRYRAEWRSNPRYQSEWSKIFNWGSDRGE